MKRISAIAKALFISEPTEAAVTNVYLMAGQSNRLGLSKNYQPERADRYVDFYPELAIAAGDELDMTRAEYPPGNMTSAPRWAQVVNRVPHTLGPVTFDGRVRGGAEIQFGRLLYKRHGAANNTTIAKFAVGGSSLSRHWMRSKSVDLSSRMIMFLAELRAKIEAGGNTFALRSFHWLQGETDANSQSDADEYAKNLIGLIAKVRRFAGNPRLPVTVALTHVAPYARSAGSKPLATVRAAQEAFVSSDRYAALVNLDDLLHDQKGVHFEPSQTDLIGRREFQALQGILARQSRARQQTAALALKPGAQAAQGVGDAMADD